MTCILKVDVEWTTIENLPIRHHQVLSDTLRYRAASATSFNPAFASGRWDGFVRLYDRQNCRFPTGLTPRVKAVLKREGYPFQVQSILPEEQVLATTYSYAQDKLLRPYQTDAVEASLRYKRGMLHMPTGSGKTRVAEEVIYQSKSPRVVFLVPNRVLLAQTKARFSEVFPDANVIQWGDGSRPSRLPDTYILVSTYQSAWKAAEQSNLLADATMLICDETHHVAADTFKTALRYSPRARHIYGLSGTPFRDDGADLELEAWVGPVLYRVDYDTLITGGYLVPPKFLRANTLQEALQYTKGLKTLIFSEKIKDLEDARDALTAPPYNTTILTGRDTSKAIANALGRLERGDITHVAATPLFDEGLDIPSIEAVIFYATGKSKVRTYQRIGRAMRPSAGKQHALVVDLVSDKFFPYRRAVYLQEPAFNKRWQ